MPDGDAEAEMELAPDRPLVSSGLGGLRLFNALARPEDVCART